MKVPQVQGKSSDRSTLLMDLYASERARGKEKSCTKRKAPGLCGFGMMDSGDVWNGPMQASSSRRVKGPSIRPFVFSLVMTRWKASR